MNLQALAAPPVLELTDVTYRRDRDEIIRGVSFTVLPGEHWAMLGPNGAGKSTLLGFCGAVTHPTSGTVRVLGQHSAGSSCRRCAAFTHPIGVRFDDGRWRARAATRQRAGT